MAGNEQRLSNSLAIAKKLGAFGWAAFFIWIGIALLANLGWGAGLLGVGVIVLAGEAARLHFGLSPDWFWMIMGIIFVMWGARIAGHPTGRELLAPTQHRGGSGHSHYGAATSPATLETARLRPNWEFV
jgi:hypothetical protein